MHKKNKAYKKIKNVGITLTVLLILLVISVFLKENWMYIDNEFSKNAQNISPEKITYFQNNNYFTNNREDYSSDLGFSNFRVLKGGRLKDNLIYRGASPYLNNERTKYVNKYLEINNIKHFISLSEDEQAIRNYINNNEYGNLYFGKNYMNGNIFDEPLNFIGINLNNKQDVIKILNTFNNISNSTEKIYIHCQLGRDRTGVYCALIEALAGFTYDDIVDDYMLSFQNYSYISKYETPDLYNKIKTNGIDTILCWITQSSNNSNLDKTNLQEEAKKFLLKNGMSEEELSSLIKHICK